MATNRFAIRGKAIKDECQMTNDESMPKLE
jgi:hypothetical protein